jgi:hypothetical protein
MRLYRRHGVGKARQKKIAACQPRALGLELPAGRRRDLLGIFVEHQKLIVVMDGWTVVIGAASFSKLEMIARMTELARLR